MATIKLGTPTTLMSTKDIDEDMEEDLSDDEEDEEDEEIEDDNRVLNY